MSGTVGGWRRELSQAAHAYAVVVDRALRDGFDQSLTGNPVATLTTTGYAPAINYAPGRAVVERKALALSRSPS